MTYFRTVIKFQLHEGHYYAASAFSLNKTVAHATYTLIRNKKKNTSQHLFCFSNMNVSRKYKGER